MWVGQDIIRKTNFFSLSHSFILVIAICIYQIKTNTETDDLMILLLFCLQKNISTASYAQVNDAVNDKIAKQIIKHRTGVSILFVTEKN
jgi:hypothetical protein